jgi:O-methyltransferase involved in polyketide biosynthesis
MPSKQPVHLANVQESLLVPLYARALEAKRKHPIVNDPKAAEIVQSIEWDFERFNQRPRMMACILRTAMFDEWVKEFVDRNPEGTVVEIGTGLNTRFERLDNGSIHWFDLDLPEAIALRRKFFTDNARRATLAASVVDSDWITAVRDCPPPYCFVAETVFVYLTEPQVRTALEQIAANFPGAVITFDTANMKAAIRGDKDHARRKLDARFVWACEDPTEIERWNIGWRLLKSRSFFDVPESLKKRLSWRARIALRLFDKLAPRIGVGYRLNLFEGA